MVYAIIKCVNGNYAVQAEGITEISAAKVQFHNLCAALWNEPSVVTASVRIVDEQLDNVQGCREYISHPQENSNESE